MKNELHWEQILISASRAMYKGCPSLSYRGARFNGQAIEMLRPYLPYCLHEVNDRNFIWLNRSYRPLGIITDDWIDYEQYPRLHVQADEPVAQLGRIYLFGDLSQPWRSREHAERYMRLINAIVSPDFDLLDNNNLAFKMLVEDDYE